MPHEEPWLALRPVQLGSQHSPEVADGYLHGIGCRPLRLPTDVIGRPGKDDSGGGVYACGC